jgi:hypothetical protein
MTASSAVEESEVTFFGLPPEMDPATSISAAGGGLPDGKADAPQIGSGASGPGAQLAQRAAAAPRT